MPDDYETFEKSVSNLTAIVDDEIRVAFQDGSEAALQDVTRRINFATAILNACLERNLGR